MKKLEQEEEWGNDWSSAEPNQKTPEICIRWIKTNKKSPPFVIGIDSSIHAIQDMSYFMVTSKRWEVIWFYIIIIHQCVQSNSIQISSISWHTNNIKQAQTYMFPKSATNKQLWEDCISFPHFTSAFLSLSFIPRFAWLWRKHKTVCMYACTSTAVKKRLHMQTNIFHQVTKMFSVQSTKGQTLL